MSIKIKIGRLAFFSLIILLIVGCSSFWSVTKLIDTNRLVTHTQEIIEQIDMVRYLITDLQRDVRTEILTGNKEEVDKDGSTPTLLVQELRKIRELTSTNPTQQKYLDDLEPQVNSGLSMLQKTIQIYEAQGYDAALRFMHTGQAHEIIDNIQDMSRKMIDTEKGLLDNRAKDAEESAKNTELTIIFGTMLAIAYVVMVGSRLASDIVTPVAKLIKGAENMGRGRFDPIAIRETDSEFVELAAAFNQLGQSLSEANETLQSEKDDKSKKVAILKKMQEQFTRLAARAEELLSVARERSYELEDYPATITSVQTVAYELSKSADELANKAIQISESAQRSHDISNATNRGYSQIQNALNVVCEKLAAASDALKALSERSDEMSEMHSAIDAIATELNLVALTASMEASRLGEQGTGFSALVERIRVIADKARHDSTKVQQMLTRVEKTATKALFSFEDASAITEPVLREAGNLGSRLMTLDEVLADTQRLALRLLEFANNHAAGHGQVPEKLDKLIAAINRQGSYSKLTEQRSKELCDIATETLLTSEPERIGHEPLLEFHEPH